MDSDRDTTAAPNTTASTANTATTKKWQFSLGSLFAITLVISLILGFLVNHESVWRIEFRCSRMPATDEGLIAWFEQQEGVTNVQVVRESERVRIEYSKREMFATFVPDLPPVRELGYTSHGMSLTADHSPYSGVANTLRPLRWPLIFGVLAALVALLVSGWWSKRTRRGESNPK
jgi:hypothetical protein